MMMVLSGFSLSTTKATAYQSSPVVIISRMNASYWRSSWRSLYWGLSRTKETIF